MDPTFMPPWKHRISDADPVSRTAVCAVCGPVSVRKNGSKLEAPTSGWRCSIGSLESKKRRRAKKKDCCERCGFVAVNARQLDVHHRDRNHANDDPSNHETICANCHRLEHAND